MEYAMDIAWYMHCMVIGIYSKCWLLFIGIRGTSLGMHSYGIVHIRFLHFTRIGRFEYCENP
jgi:uncharacterized membrane protein YoaT (DUF817 family)